MQSVASELLLASTAEVEAGRVREQVWSESEIAHRLLVITHKHTTRTLAHSNQRHGHVLS